MFVYFIPFLTDLIPNDQTFVETVRNYVQYLRESAKTIICFKCRWQHNIIFDPNLYFNTPDMYVPTRYGALFFSKFKGDLSPLIWYE